jgi:hypothetical protein
MEWPPNSPDMNPIEHMWLRLKNSLYRKYPDTKFVPGGPETVRKVLEERLTDIWADIEAEAFESLVESMPRRVADLLAAKGWYTGY